MQGPSKERVSKVIEGLDKLGQIPWIAFVDNDSAELAALEGCVGSDGVPLSESQPQVVTSGQKQLEQLLFHAGYHQEIETVANEHARWLPPNPKANEPRLLPYTAARESTYLQFLAKTKGWSGKLIARATMKNGREVPAPIVELVSHIRQALHLDESVALEAGVAEEES